MLDMAAQPRIKSEVLTWIEKIMDRKGWTGTELARKSELAPSTILRMLNDPHHNFTPSLRTLRKIAGGAHEDIPENVLRSYDVEQLGEPTRAPFQRVPLPGASVVAPARRAQVKVKYVSALPKGLQPTDGSDVYVAAPPQLEGDDSAFGFYMPGSDLEPWVPAGSLCFATRKRDPKVGDVVMITKKDGRSFVRVVMDVTEKGFSLSKSHPARKEEMIPFDDVEDYGIVQVWTRS